MHLYFCFQFVYLSYLVNHHSSKILRLLGRYKKYVKNKARPDGSIMQACMAKESLTFCSMYLTDVETAFTRPERNDDGPEPSATLSVFAQKVRPIGGHTLIEWSEKEMEVAYWYILDNCEEIEIFKEYVIIILYHLAFVQNLAFVFFNKV